MAAPSLGQFPVPLPAPPDGALVLVAGCLAVVLLFVAREVATGALRKAGEDLWAWLKRREGR